jgi:hypothetical protein
MDGSTLRMVQDQAYEESLLRDRGVMERREEEEERKAMQEVLELSRREDDERQLRELAAAVPPEPPVGSDACSLAFRLPDGSRIQRRLMRSDTIGLLRRVVASQRAAGASVPNRFAIVMDYPRRRFDDDAQTLESAGMWPRAAINIVELEDESANSNN